MRKFRLIIRIAAILFIPLTLLIGIYADQIAAEGLTPLWKKGYITFLENSLNWWTVGLLIGLLQVIGENIHLINLKNNLTGAEIEIERLKGQLAQSATAKPIEPKGRNKVAFGVIIAFFIYMVSTILINLYLIDLLNIGVYTFYRFLIAWGILGLVIMTLRLFFDLKQSFGHKRRLRKLEKEVLELKASLFDKGSENPPVPAPEIPENQELQDSSNED